MTKVFNLPGEIPSSLDEEKNNMNNHFIVYPNPNSGSFFVNFHGNNGDFNIIDLYSVTGKLIDTYKSNNNLIHINNYGLSEGMYLLNNRHEKINSTTKMIIKK